MLRILNQNKYLHSFGVALLAAAGAAVVPASSAYCASADTARDYPNRPIRYILPGGPGSNADVFSRILTIKMSEILGQQVVVDSRPARAA